MFSESISMFRNTFSETLFALLFNLLTAYYNVWDAGTPWFIFFVYI